MKELEKKEIQKTKKSIRGLIKEVKQGELKYENLLFLLAGLIVAYILISPAHFQLLKNLIENSGSYGYFGIFIAGFFFTYGFTCPVSTVSLIAFGSIFSPLAVAFIGSAGATLGDYIIFKISKRKLAGEIEKLESKEFFKNNSKLIHKFAPIIAGFIIASPLPDEIGAAILGIEKFNDKKFLIYIFIVEFIGILVLATIGSAV